MAVGPLALLIILNIFVVCQVVRSPKDPGWYFPIHISSTHVYSQNLRISDSDIVSLILVVCLFIFCNFMALLVNFLELTLYGLFVIVKL
jgi:hypothetical protein